ncbi:MAG: hypothetical protein IBX57_00535 [Gammaproteobacteria bacterium]|nr:hypothetical protein [Gammaproteobacteria bacterium]
MSNSYGIDYLVSGDRIILRGVLPEEASSNERISRMRKIVNSKRDNKVKRLLHERDMRKVDRELDLL